MVLFAMHESHVSTPQVSVLRVQAQAACLKSTRAPSASELEPPHLPRTPPNRDFVWLLACLLGVKDLQPLRVPDFLGAVAATSTPADQVEHQAPASARGHSSGGPQRVFVARFSNTVF